VRTCACACESACIHETYTVHLHVPCLSFGTFCVCEFVHMRVRVKVLAYLRLTWRAACWPFVTRDMPYPVASACASVQVCACVCSCESAYIHETCMARRLLTYVSTPCTHRDACIHWQPGSAQAPAVPKLAANLSPAWEILQDIETRASDSQCMLNTYNCRSILKIIIKSLWNIILGRRAPLHSRANEILGNM